MSPSLSHMTPVKILTPCFLATHFSIILPSAFTSSRWPIFVRFSDRNLVHVFHLSQACYMLCLGFNCPDTVWRRIQVSMPSSCSSSSCYSSLLRFCGSNEVCLKVHFCVLSRTSVKAWEKCCTLRHWCESLLYIYGSDFIVQTNVSPFISPGRRVEIYLRQALGNTRLLYKVAWSFS